MLSGSGSEGNLAEAIDLLRATTFNGYRNAYFYDRDHNKIYIEVHLEH